jgi:colicin import membrane protein
MENAIVKINPTEYGLTDETAARIEAQFTPMLARMTELEGEYNAILGLNIEDPNTAKLAKDLRLKYVKVRTGTADIHKVQKAYFLNGGRFVDGWKNAQLFASQGKEESLERIEKHAENLERERLEKLQQLRVALLAEYVENASELSLSGMEQDVFEAYLSTKKQQYEDRKAAELKAEQDRIAREKAEAEERAAQRLENIRLKEEADKREAEIKEAADKLAKAEKELADKKAAEAKAESDRIAAEKAAKLEAEKLAKAPIKAQLTAWVNLFAIPTANIEHEKKVLIEEKFNRFLDWAKSEINNI